MLGGHDDTYVLNKSMPGWRNVTIVETSELTGFYYWTIELSAVRWGTAQRLVGGKAILDTGTSYIFLNQELYASLLDALPGGSDSIAVDGRGNAYCPKCTDGAPSLEFFINPHMDEAFIVDSKYYLDCEGYELGCLIRVSTGDYDVMILGVPFLQAYTAMYFPEDKVVSLANAAIIDNSHLPGSDLAIAAIVSGIVLLFAAFLLLGYPKIKTFMRERGSRRFLDEPLLSTEINIDVAREAEGTVDKGIESNNDVSRADDSIQMSSILDDENHSDN